MTEPDSQRLRYEQWVRCYAPALFSYALRISGRRAVAEDLLQETFLEAWKSMNRQTVEDGARGWLFQILRRRHAHYLRDSRHHRNQGQLPDDLEADSKNGSHLPLDVLAEQDALQKALNVLSLPIRQTFLMVFAEGRTCRETAAILEIPLGTVLSRLDNARRALRGALNQSPQVMHDLPMRRRNSAAL